MTNGHSIIATALSGSMVLLSTVGLSAQEKTPCYEITVPNGDSMSMGLGSILLNKCTGEAWLLLTSKVSDGTTAFRWFPIKVGDGEAGLPSTQPMSAPPTRK